MLAADYESGGSVTQEAKKTPDTDNDWQPIETAPRDRDIMLAAFIEPSDEARRNGSREFWHYAIGRWMYGITWTGILGGKPSHWMEA